MISIHLPDRRPGLRLAKMFVGILAIAILSHGASAAASADGTYTINLSPPAKAGDKYRYSSTATEKVKSTVLMAGRDPVVQDRNSSVELDGAVEVLAIDSTGSATKMTCIVERCERVEGKERSEVLPRGSVVIVEAVPKDENPGAFGTRYSLKEGTLTAEQMAAVGLVIAAKLPKAPTDQEIWGTDRPQKLGSSWAIDGRKGAAFLARMGISMEPKDLTGQSKLTGVETFAGTECLRVESAISSQRFGVALPAGVKLEKSSVEMRFVVLVPKDGKPTGRSSYESHVDIVARGNNAETGAFTAHNSADTNQVIGIRPLGNADVRRGGAAPDAPSTSTLIERADYRISLPKGSTVEPPGDIDADRYTSIKLPNDNTVAIVVLDDKKGLEDALGSMKSSIKKSLKEAQETPSDLFRNRSGSGGTLRGKISGIDFRFEVGGISGKKKAFVITSHYAEDEAKEMKRILEAALNSFVIKE